MAGAGWTGGRLSRSPRLPAGSNDDGQLGIGEDQDRGDDQDEMGDNLPAVALGLDLTVKEFSCGGDHTCALLSNDQIKCWGGFRIFL
jgi:E3 ubiquitin-protein ligase HERC3